MSNALHKKSILKKTFQVGSSTMLSRVLGVIRERLLSEFLGNGALSDAFLTAFKIPNMLRKIFAEGALSAAFVPRFMQVKRRKGVDLANSLMTLSFIVFEGLVLFFCALVIYKAAWVIWLIAPGFSQTQIARAVPFLQILMPFIFFISSSALIAGALQSEHHFFVPAFSPVLLNIVFITGLSVCLYFQLPVEALCYFVLLGGLLQLIFHIIAYIKLNFSFAPVNVKIYDDFKWIFVHFWTCFAGMSVMEIGLIVDSWFASFLPTGSITLIYYANRFMGIPLGVFAVAFSTILLPHFARVNSYAPSRLSFYLLESTKFVFWVTIPIAVFMSVFSSEIFSTILFSKKFTALQITQSAHILSAFLLGLFFFSLNKILFNLYSAQQVTWLPSVIVCCSTIINFGLNWLLMPHFQAAGLALATSGAAAVQTILFIIFLKYWFGYKFYYSRFFEFFMRYIVQLVPVFSFFFGFLFIIRNYVLLALPANLYYLFSKTILVWLWIGPLCATTFLLLYFTKKQFGIHLHFID